MKSYIYENARIIAQHTGDHQAGRYFYLHDRLGSVRQIIDTNGDVVAYYTYEPFGRRLQYQEKAGTNLDNPFLFAGQWFDEEIDQYYLRARQYDPFLGRFTSRDPVFGEFKEPLTLHRYLYCLNDPINRIDLNGEWTTSEISVTTGLRGFVFGSRLGGTRNAILGKSFWKGALSGGLATGTPAFFGVYGVAAAMVSGGMNAGISADFFSKLLYLLRI